MADPVETDKTLNSPELTNCLEFSRKLVSSGKEFKFFVKIGNSFVFNLSSKESGTSSSINENRKKKPSPSTKRRNAVRLHEFLEKKNTSTKETLECDGQVQNTRSKNWMNNDKETFQCNQYKLQNMSEKELSEHMKAKHSKEYFRCDQCDSQFENEKGLKSHQGKKHKLTSSPIPQVDGQMDEIDVDMVSKKKLDKKVEEESPKNSKSQNLYSCKNFKFKCEGHETLKDHIKSCQEALALANKAPS